MYYPVWDGVYLKNPFLLIGKINISFLPVHQILFSGNITAQWYKKGRKELFYLMMHSTHFIYGKGPVSKKGTRLPPHRLLF